MIQMLDKQINADTRPYSYGHWSTGGERNDEMSVVAKGNGSWECHQDVKRTNGNSSLDWEDKGETIESFVRALDLDQVDFFVIELRFCSPTWEENHDSHIVTAEFSRDHFLKEIGLESLTY